MLLVSQGGVGEPGKHVYWTPAYRHIGERWAVMHTYMQLILLGLPGVYVLGIDHASSRHTTPATSYDI